MKRVRTIVFDVMFICALLFISGMHVLTLPAMLIHTTWRTGWVESVITAKDTGRKIHVAYVEGKMVSTEFSSSYGILWEEEGSVVSSFEDEEILIGRSTNDTSTILYGMCRSDKVRSIIVEKDDGESIQVKVNRDGLFAVIYDGKYQDVTMISGVDKEGKIISQIKK